jgi:hypothetical protein
MFVNVKRFTTIFLLIGTMLITAKAQEFAMTQQPTCADNLEVCPVKGCSSDNHHDPNLNILKNIGSINTPITDRTLSWMKSRKNPEHLVEKGERSELTNMGEGQQVRVVGYLLAVKPELGGESCNCYLRTAETTDNHLVLVTKNTIEKFPLPPNANISTIRAVFKKREAESVTAEFAPRTRSDHPNFTFEKTQPLINTTAQGALLVRITGQLMFDSEHFWRHKLNRVNDWEIHPIFRFEYCPKGKTCTATGNNNWVDID